MFLRQSTSQVIRFGPCLDITDGVTEETSLTLAQADMRLSKDGGAFAQKNASGNATHDSDGWYSTTLDATDTNTVGELILNVHQPANTLPVWMRFYVVEEAIYDALFASSAAAFDSNQRVDVGSVLGTAQTANDNGADINTLLTRVPQTLNLTASGNIGVDWANVENPGSTVDLSATDINLVDTVTSNTDMRGTDGANTTTPLSAAGVRSAVGLAAPNLDTQLGAIPTDTEMDTKFTEIKGAGWSSGDTLEAVIDSIAALNDFDPATDQVDADVVAINAISNAAVLLAAMTQGGVSSTTAASSTTTVVETNLTEATDDHYNGGVVIFTSGALAGQRSDISDYNGTTKQLTVTALTEAPASGVSFVIV